MILCLFQNNSCQFFYLNFLYSASFDRPFSNSKERSSTENQSGAWYAEAVEWAVIRKLENIKTLQGFKKFSGWRSRRSLPWVTQGMSCKQSIKANLYIYFTCRVGMIINPQILEISLQVRLCHAHQAL